MGVSYPSAEVQSVYSTVPADWATEKVITGDSKTTTAERVPRKMLETGDFQL